MTRESDKGAKQGERLQERKTERVEASGRRKAENQGVSEEKHGQNWRGRRRG